MRNSLILVSILITVAQILLSNYFHFTPYIALNILPLLILVLPVRMPSSLLMLIAFAAGLCVDFLAEGVAGINAFALVPVAFCRRWICQAVFGRELFERQSDISTRRFGFPKIFTAMLMMQAFFFLFYIFVDGVGTRPLPFYMIKFAGSTLASSILSAVSLDLILPEIKR